MHKCKYILLSICLVITFSCVLHTSNMDLYYESKSMERSAISKSDFKKVILKYKKFLKTTSPDDDIEIIASCYFSIGEIFLNKLKKRQSAYKYFKKVIRSYPDSSWFSVANTEISKIKVKKSILPVKMPFRLPTKSKTKSKGVVQYKRKLVSKDILEKVDISEVKEVLRKIKQAKETPPDLVDNEQVPTGSDLILKIFTNYGVKKKNLIAIAYQISFSGKTTKGNDITVSGYRNKKSKIILVNQIGVMLKNKKKFLFFKKKKLFHQITKKSPKNMKYLYLSIMDKYCGLMFLNDFNVFAPDISYEESRENHEVMRYYPLVKSFKSYFKLILNMGNKPYFKSASFGSNKFEENDDMLKLKKFIVGKPVSFNLKKYKSTNTPPAGKLIPE